MDRSTKEKLIGEYSEIFKNSLSAVLVDYQGMSVEELTNLRKKLFGKQSNLRVLKNTLAKRAAEGTAYSSLSEEFSQSRALIYSSEDAVGHAKVVSTEAKKNDKLKIIAGTLVTGDTSEFLDGKGVEALGNLPSREDLIVKLLFLFNSPATKLVRTLKEVPAGLVRVLNAVAESKK